MQRRRDVIDDNLAAEVIEEIGDSVWEPPEVLNLFVLHATESWKASDGSKFWLGIKK